MVRASVILTTAMVFGVASRSTAAETRPHVAPAAAPASAPSKEQTIQWKLWVGKKAYGLSRQGGTAPLPGSSDWQCRYSGTTLEKNKRNLKEETVTLSCWAGRAQISFSTTCGYPVDPHKPVAEGVMPSESQHVVLGGRTVVGLSCEVPGYELRTYRKK